MANIISITSMKITNPIKELVSKRKKRYTDDGFNLDLSYIRPNLIAMGFPAAKIEGVYRNNIEEVFKFFELKHANSYKIYNLCIESDKNYDITKFHSRVGRFPFSDHNPPSIKLIQDFCKDVHEWLEADKDHVAAVHCKAGKGRTGTMICCYMIYSGLCSSASNALSCYAKERTHDNKGVTIPSQRRYVEYYARLLNSPRKYEAVPLKICEIRLSPSPCINSHQGPLFLKITYIDDEKECTAYKDEVPVHATLSHLTHQHHTTTNNTTTTTANSHTNNIITTVAASATALANTNAAVNHHHHHHAATAAAATHTNTHHAAHNTISNGSNIGIRIDSNGIVIDLNKSNTLSGDIKVEFYTKQKMTRKKKPLFGFWFNTFFESERAIDNNSPSIELVLPKHEIDVAHKDMLGKQFPQNFEVRLKLMPSERMVDDDMHDSRLNIINTDQRTSSMNSFVDAHTPSESPEASSSESSTGGDWESGEFKQNELVVDHWPKQRTPSKNKQKLASHKSSTTQTTLTTTSNSSIPAKLSHQHQFKAKSNSIKIFSNPSNMHNMITHNNNNNHNNNNHNHIINNSQLSKMNTKKMRWLSNMSSDPDFRETFVKTVTIQRCNTITAQSSDSLNNQDYYSAICDTQLSVGSPYKSPDSMYGGSGEPFRWRARTNSSTRRRHPMHHRLHSVSGYSPSMLTSTSLGATTTMTTTTMATGNRGCDDDDGNEILGPTLVIARRTVEHQAIGFNVIDSNSNNSNNSSNNCKSGSASGKPTSNGGLAFDAMDADCVRKRNECAINVHAPQSKDVSPKRSKSMAETDNVTLGVTTSTTNGHSHTNGDLMPSSTAAIAIAIEQTANPSNVDRFNISKSDAINDNCLRWLPPSSANEMDCDVVDAGVCNTSKTINSSGCSTTAPLMASNCALSLSSSSSSTSSSATNPTAKRRYPPFSFREIRNEILSVMRSRNNPK